MRISKISIKNLFGISEVELGDKNLELTGKNGTGKSSIIDAIRLALENKSGRDYIIKQGATAGEIIVETDGGITISRKVREGKADVKSIKKDDKEVPQPETFLKNLFVPMQLDPVAFLTMHKNDQNRAILNLIEFDWNLDWIRSKFGEIPMGVDYDQNILSVLSDIQAEKGSYFQTRQEKNRKARDHRAIADDILKTIPEAFDVAKWESENLSALHKRVHEANAKNAEIDLAASEAKAILARSEQLEAELTRQIMQVGEETERKRAEISQEIAVLRERIEGMTKELADLDERAQEAIKTKKIAHSQQVVEAKELYQKKLAQSEQPKIDVTELVEAASNAEKMKMHIPNAKKVEQIMGTIEALTEESNKLTEKIELARTLPAEILKTATLPVEGLTVVDGVPLINGLPVSNLSEGEKLDLCVSIASANKTALQIVLIDGIERLATDMRNRLYEKCREKGIQFIASRTTDDESLTVTEL